MFFPFILRLYRLLIIDCHTTLWHYGVTLSRNVYQTANAFWPLLVATCHIAHTDTRGVGIDFSVMVRIRTKHKNVDQREDNWSGRKEMSSAGMDECVAFLYYHYHCWAAGTIASRRKEGVEVICRKSIIIPEPFCIICPVRSEPA